MVAWLADALDAYVRALGRHPIIANAAVREGVARAYANDEGLAGRIRSVAEATEQTGSPEAALVEIAIFWRNRLVHRLSGNQIPRNLVRVVRDHAEEFVSIYQGLRIEDLIKRAQSKPAVAPTVKEVTAIVRSAHKYIERADAFLLRELDLERYLRDILHQYLVEDIQANPRSVMSRASNIWGKSPDRRRSTIIQIAMNNGFTNYRAGVPNELVVTTIDEFINLTPKQAIATLNAE
jgi:hypothetical protein